MSLSTVLDEIAAYIKPKVPELRDCKMVGTRISLAETDRRSLRFPAAYVTGSGTRDARYMGNKFRTRGQFALILVASSKVEGQADPQDRAHLIADLVTRVLMVVAAAKNWGSDEVEGPPENVHSSNAYTAAADEKGVALWAITWDQMLALTAGPPPPPLDSFTKLDADHQITPSNPEIDAEDTLILDGG